jgi:hypothetical protein
VNGKIRGAAIDRFPISKIGKVFRFILASARSLAYFSGFERELAAMEQRERNFSTLENMCRERARTAEKEMHYWLAEAEEWARLKKSSGAFAESAATQLDCFVELNS